MCFEMSRFHPAEWPRAAGDTVRTGLGLVWASVATWSSMFLHVVTKVVPVYWGVPRRGKKRARTA